MNSDFSEEKQQWMLYHTPVFNSLCRTVAHKLIQRGRSSTLGLNQEQACGTESVPIQMLATGDEQPFSWPGILNSPPQRQCTSSDKENFMFDILWLRKLCQFAPCAHLSLWLLSPAQSWSVRVTLGCFCSQRNLHSTTPPGTSLAFCRSCHMAFYCFICTSVREKTLRPNSKEKQPKFTELHWRISTAEQFYLD